MRGPADPKCAECANEADVAIETNGVGPVYACFDCEVEIRTEALRKPADSSSDQPEVK